MKSIFIITTTLIVLFSCKKEDPSPAQILKNTDMESISSSDQSWYNHGTGSGFNAILTNEESFSPVYSLKLSRTDTDPLNYWYYYQKYDGQIPVGRNLTLKAKIKGINLTGKGVSIAIRCDGSEPGLQFVSSQSVTKIDGNFDWTTYSLNLNEIQSNVSSIWVFLVYLDNTTGTAYFDDVTMTHD